MKLIYWIFEWDIQKILKGMLALPFMLIFFVLMGVAIGLIYPAMGVSKIVDRLLA